MRRGHFFATSRRGLRDLVEQIGGRNAQILHHLAVEADIATGIVRGNLRDLADLLGLSIKQTRTSLARLEEIGVVEWIRGRGPGENGEGFVRVLVMEQLDSRPPKKRTATENTQVACEPAPRPPPTTTEPEPDRHGLPGETSPRQKTENNKTRPHISELTQVERLISPREKKFIADLIEYEWASPVHRGDWRFREAFNRERLSRYESGPMLERIAPLLARTDVEPWQLFENIVTGRGIPPDPAEAECPACEGIGIVYVDDPALRQGFGAAQCSHCRSTGKILIR